MRISTFLFLIFISVGVHAQYSYPTISLFDDVTLTFDYPKKWDNNKPAVFILYALPNGNTTAQTMGKKINPSDDWHFNIQHIRAQTEFIRRTDTLQNYVVIYLENTLLSWPAWKKKHADYKEKTQIIVDTATSAYKNARIYLSSHSGGGSFIFGFLDGISEIPNKIQRLIFLDSNYGYESRFESLFTTWLLKSEENNLQVFAYDDSKVEINGKRIVSDTGGTWFRTNLMIEDFKKRFSLEQIQNDSLQLWQSKNGTTRFYLKPNPEKKIYHTVQVERNGFIQAILAGTEYENIGYRYWAERAYQVQ